MEHVLKGKPVADALNEQTLELVQRLAAEGIVPTLAILRVGHNDADVTYERNVIKKAQTLGLETRTFILDADATQDELLEAIGSINNDASLHGCLMFRPLPLHIDELATCNAIAPQKDVDGVGAQSLAGVFMNLPEGFAPCTAQACIELLDYYEVDLSGKKACVVGRSLVVGRPLSMMLLARHATVTTCHSRTVDLTDTMRQADIVVCATGRARSYGADCFAPGQMVLDVGTNVDEEGIFCGDVDYASVEPLVGAITPVPGGIGSITTSVLLQHVAQAASRQIAGSAS